MPVEGWALSHGFVDLSGALTKCQVLYWGVCVGGGVVVVTTVHQRSLEPEGRGN